MLRWLILGLLLFGIGTGLRDGWLVIKWSQLLNQVGFSEIDPEKPMDWDEFLYRLLNRDPQQASTE